MYDEEVRKEALAQYLGLDGTDDIEQDSWDECSFTISPRTVKEGKPPAYWLEHGQNLRQMLGALDPEKTTWQEWATISNELYMDEMLVLLSRHPGYNSGKYATEASAAVRAFYKADPHNTSGLGAKMRESRDRASNQRLLEGIMAMNKMEFVVYDRIKARLTAAGMAFEDFGVNENDLWHLIAEDKYDSWHVYAIRAAFNGEEVEDRRRDGYRDSGQYLVLDDEEADEKAKEYIEDSLWAFAPWFLANMTDMPQEAFAKLAELYDDANEAVLAMVEKTCGLDKLVEAAISADGRGHFLNRYDGTEDEFTFTDEDGEEIEFYIYRTN